MKALSLIIQKILPLLKFLQTDRQTKDRWTDGLAINYMYMPPIFLYWSIKMTQDYYSTGSFFYNLHGEKLPQGHKFFEKGSRFYSSPRGT
jgi:hypothetical protein